VSLHAAFAGREAYNGDAKTANPAIIPFGFDGTAASLVVLHANAAGQTLTEAALWATLKPVLAALPTPQPSPTPKPTVTAPPSATPTVVVTMPPDTPAPSATDSPTPTPTSSATAPSLGGIIVITLVKALIARLIQLLVTRAF
jgi:hypothetical protein